MRWFNFGPLQVQFSRVVLYGVFFFAGMGIGAANIDQGLLARTGALARRWYIWVVAAAVSFGALTHIGQFPADAADQPARCAAVLVAKQLRRGVCRSPAS